MNFSNNIPEYRVSQFNKLFKEVIESNFDYIRIKGEISEIKNATKGQIYLTLKDDESILSGVIWDTKKKYLKFNPEIGMEVIVTGKITTWSRYKTTYQIDIDKVELAGEGALLKLINDRKKRLENKGMFDSKFKNLIPYLPNRIGIITSPTGSVIHDIINRIKERFPINLDLWPVSVQGSDAAKDIIFAIKSFNSKLIEDKPDVLIIARGGGSTEDLMAFNDENLAIEVFNSKIPIISAIGHETDTTIIDYVSDLRASTPTAAAEKVVPLQSDLRENLNSVVNNLLSLLDSKFEKNSYELKNILNLLKAPNFIINSFKETFSNTMHFFNKEFHLILTKKNNEINNIKKNLRAPKSDIIHFNKEINSLSRNINQLFYEYINKNVNEYNKLNRLLNSNSIASNLRKGYSIISKSKKIIKKSQQIKNNDSIQVNFFHNSIRLKIKKIN